MIPDNRITLLQNGEAYFPAMEAALDRAMHEIYLESYIFEDDTTGKRIMEALIRAALRGVKTRILIDGFGSNSFPKTMINYLEAAGVMVMKFRPRVSPWTLRRRRLRRLHRKIVVVDMKIAFVGGINVSDDMDISGRQSIQFDYAVQVEGPLVAKIHRSARRAWSRVAWARLRSDLVLEKKRHELSVKPMGNVCAAFIIRDNIRHRRDIENAYLQAIAQAQFEIIIASAYFFPGSNFRHVLLAAARRGVRVVLLLQGKTDHSLLHYASHAMFDNFLDAGIEIYEYRKSLLHAKVAVIDEHWATVGSSNLDPFSLLLSLEANVIIDDGNFAKKLKYSLEQAVRIKAHQVLKNNWRAHKKWLRLANWICYGLVRLLTGITGYAQGENRER